MLGGAVAAGVVVLLGHVGKSGQEQGSHWNAGPEKVRELLRSKIEKSFFCREKSSQLAIPA
jgi:hypothetical protein